MAKSKKNTVYCRVLEEFSVSLAADKKSRVDFESGDETELPDWLTESVIEYLVSLKHIRIIDKPKVTIKGEQ